MIVRFWPVLLVGFVLGCAATPHRFPAPAPHGREPEKPFSPPPGSGELTGMLGPLRRALALAAKGPACDVDADDEVPDSSFYQNRSPLPDEVRTGGEAAGALDLERPIRVIAAPPNGLEVIDGAGRRFALRFDPVGLLGLATGSEAVSARLLWALGYRVPDTRVVLVAPDRFVAAALPAERVAEVLARAARAPDGRVRAVAVRIPSGRPLSPMPWRGTREGDPNDRIPHQDRRSLRALRVFYAWIHKGDASSEGGTLDVWVPQGAGGIVEHYLVDFAGTLAAGGRQRAAIWWEARPLRPAWAGRPGTASIYDSPAAADLMARLRREAGGDLLGGLPARVDPWGYAFGQENDAFARLDAADAAWAARVLSRITDEQLRAAVDAAEWPADVAGRAVARLAARRDSILQAIFAVTVPFGRADVEGARVCAEDLAAARRLGAAPGRSYRVEGAAAVAVEGARVCAELPSQPGPHVLAFRPARPPGAPAAAALRVEVARRGGDLAILRQERGARPAGESVGRRVALALPRALTALPRAALDVLDRPVTRLMIAADRFQRAPSPEPPVVILPSVTLALHEIPAIGAVVILPYLVGRRAARTVFTARTAGPRLNEMILTVRPNPALARTLGASARLVRRTDEPLYLADDGGRMEVTVLAADGALEGGLRFGRLRARLRGGWAARRFQVGFEDANFGFVFVGFDRFGAFDVSRGRAGVDVRFDVGGNVGLGPDRQRTVTALLRVDTGVPLVDGRAFIFSLLAGDQESLGEPPSFYDRLSLGGFNTQRGFNEGRFRGGSVLQLSADYRFPLRFWLDGFVFVDHGGAFGERFAGLSWERLHTSVGAGIHVFRRGELAVRALVGWGIGEGLRAALAFGAP